MSQQLPVLVAGGGIGGLAAALALVRQGFAVKVLEQAAEIGEIGAGIQLGPNAFHAFDALGVGDKARRPRGLHRLHGDARRDRRVPGRQDPDRRKLSQALRQSLCGDPSPGHPHLAARRRAGNRQGRVPHQLPGRKHRAGCATA
jgi:2-polyprenyl-6-methoxyphenol hydroxylase-like FAD-dependent oxidoreductase